jgi:hypothetical protein
MGLCYERLRLTTRAISAYELIAKGADELTKAKTAMSPQLGIVVEQARWRHDHLNWSNDTNTEIQKMLGE